MAKKSTTTAKKPAAKKAKPAPKKKTKKEKVAIPVSPHDYQEGAPIEGDAHDGSIKEKDLEEKKTVVCCVTGMTTEVKLTKDGTPKVPKFWKRLDGKFYSQKGWKKKFHQKTVTIPVASVLIGHKNLEWSNENGKISWRRFRQAVKNSQRAAQQAANYIMRFLASIDNEPPIVTKEEKGYLQYSLPKFSVGDYGKAIYAGARNIAPNLDSQSLSSLMQRVISKYNDTRYDVKVKGTMSLVSFRDKIPVPIPSKDAKLYVEEDGRIGFRFRMDGERFTIRLKSTGDREYHSFYRQIGDLKKVLNNQAVLGEVSVYERSNSITDRGNGGTTRETKGSNKFGTRIMFGISLHLPVKNPQDDKEKIRPEKFVTVRTGKDKLLSAIVENSNREWSLHDTHVRRELASQANRNERREKRRLRIEPEPVADQKIKDYNQRLNELSDDTKFERRLPKRNQSNIKDVRNRVVRSHNDWINTYIHKVARMVVGLAIRNRCTKFNFDDSEQGFSVRFPYYKLKQTIEDKLKEHGGIEFIHVNKNKKDSDSEPESELNAEE